MHQPAMRSDHVTQPNDVRIPPTFLQAGAARFWLAVLCVGIGGGVSAILLTRLLEIVQHLVWAGSGTDMIAGIRGSHDVSDEEGSFSDAAIGGAPEARQCRCGSRSAFARRSLPVSRWHSRVTTHGRRRIVRLFCCLEACV